MKKIASILSIILLASPAMGLPQAAKEVTVESGTVIRVALQSQISSKINEVGDSVTAVLYEPLRIDGNLVLARGTEFQGRITQIQEAKRPQRQASMTIVFDKLITPYGEENIATTISSIDDYANDEKLRSDEEGKVKGKRDGGRTAENARTGGILGGIGASIILLSGGGAGGAIGALGGGVLGGVLMTKGKEIRLQPGTILRLKFERPITLPVTSPGSPQSQQQ